MPKRTRVNVKNRIFRLDTRRWFSHTLDVEVPSRGFSALFSNPVFISGALSILIAQLIKAFLTILKRKQFKAKEIAFIMLWKTGGMPSSHSALVVSMSTSIAFIEGFNDLFVLSFFLGLIVIRDALGVRRSAGLQSKALNLLGKRVSERLDIPFAPVKEIHGHRWPEVIAGCLLGFIVSMFVCRGFIFSAVSSSM